MNIVFNLLYFVRKTFFLLSKKIVYFAVHIYKTRLTYNSLNFFSYIKVKAFQSKLVFYYFDELLNCIF